MTWDDQSIREMVEDHFRLALPLNDVDVELRIQADEQFVARVCDVAAAMGQPAGRQYVTRALDTLDEMRREEARSPKALRKRLGVPTASPSPPIQRTRTRQSVGEMAARTAVRATVWQLVRAAFRGFR